MYGNFRKVLFTLALTAGISWVLLGGPVSFAQTSYPQTPPLIDPTAPTAQQQFSPDQLDDLVAPIALYPDQLLSQVLVASTYPLEVVEAQQWVQRNRGMQGTQLMDAARQQPWDASVQALVAFPDVLSRLNSDVQWTTQLGNAFLAQQADVMAAVQRMRARAQANGRLASNTQQVVTTETQGGQAAIEIQPANPQVVYVPYYDPAYVWGPPVYGYYPPLYYPAFGFGYYPAIDVGFWFGGWGGWGWGGWGWGWGPNWFGRNVFVNVNFFNRYGFHGGFNRGFGGGFAGGRGIWTHDASHRLGVAYPNRQLAGRFQAASLASRSSRFGAQGFANRSFAGRQGASFSGSRQGFQSGSQGFAGSRFQSGQGVRGGQAGQGSQGFRGGQQSFRGGQTFQGNQSFRNNQGSRGGQTFQGNQGFRGGQALQGNQGFRGGQTFQGGTRSFQSAPRSFSSAPSRSFSGGGTRSFSAPAPRSFNGGGGGGFSGGSAPRSFGGGGGGGSAPRSFSGGGGGHSFGGGGGHSFGGGGGGGGHSGRGGGHGRR